MSEQAFEFELEHTGKTYQLRADGQCVELYVKETYANRPYIRTNLIHQSYKVFIALLSERAHREKCWRELMDTTKAMRDELASQGYQTVAFDDVMIQLQWKWERGEA